MEKNELVVRTIDENDKRIYRLTVTDKGLDAVVNRKLSENNELTFEGFTEDELNSFIEMCDRLKAYIESVTPERDEDEMPHCHHGRMGHHRPTEGRFPESGRHRHHHEFVDDDQPKEM